MAAAHPEVQAAADAWARDAGLLGAAQGEVRLRLVQGQLIDSLGA